MNNFKILIVDDEPRMRKIIKDFLATNGYDIFEAENGQKALELFDIHNNINLIILDVMMPVLDGWSTLREIRKKSNLPVIMLTARGEESDELFGFELGVDEYISKPFSPKILVARVEALLKRCYPNNKSITDFDGIIIDTDAHIVTVDGVNADLSMKEFELLEYLIQNKGVALSREKILNNVCSCQFFI